MRISLNPDGASITEAELVVSAEAFTANELHWLQHQMWLLAQTTVSERLSAYASHAECIFAALTNDTDAIILHMEQPA